MKLRAFYLLRSVIVPLAVVGLLLASAPYARAAAPANDDIANSEDPTPFEMVLSIEPNGLVDPETGVASIHGTLSCTHPVSVDVHGELVQRAGRSSVKGYWSTTVSCTGEVAWSVEVAAVEGSFRRGRADASATAYANDWEEYATAEDAGAIRLKGSRD